jgi:hypothetical protein
MFWIVASNNTAANRAEKSMNASLVICLDGLLMRSENEKHRKSGARSEKDRLALLQNLGLLNLPERGLASTPVDPMTYESKDEQPSIFSFFCGRIRGKRSSRFSAVARQNRGR